MNPKDRTFLVDGDLVKIFLKDNAKYLSDKNKRQIFMNISSLLDSSSGYIYNTEQLIKMLSEMSSGKESVIQEKLFGQTVLSMIRDGKNWMKLSNSANTIIDEHEEEWNAAFYSDNTNERNEDVIEHAKNKMNHVFSLSEILAHQTSKRKFSSLMNGTKELIKDKDSPFVRSKDFFAPFTHPSKSFSIIDPHLFTSKKGGQFGNNSPLGKNFKYDHFDDEFFEQTLKGLLLYTDWIYSIYKNTNWKLPEVYFIGGPVAKVFGQNRMYKEETMVVLSLIFKKKVLKLKDLNTPSSNGIRFFIELLEKDKIHLLTCPNNLKQQLDIHDNTIMTDYGYIKWDLRKWLFQYNLNEENYNWAKGKEKQTIHFPNIFSVEQATNKEKSKGYSLEYRKVQSILKEIGTQKKDVINKLIEEKDIETLENIKYDPYVREKIDLEEKNGNIFNLY